MNKLEFEFEWTDPAGARGDELRATWSRLCLSLNGESLTRVYDRVSRSVRDGVYVPLYPLAEWIVSHWWFLLYEVETPGRQAEVDYRRRHNFLFARKGFAYPPLFIAPTGSSVRLQWSREKLDYGNVEFIGEGSAYVSLTSFANFAQQLIRAVVERLEEGGVTGTPLAEEWREIESSQADEKSFCIASATLGLDPYSLNDRESESIVEVAGKLPANLEREFFTIADYSKLASQTDQLARALELSRENEADLAALKELRSKASGLSLGGGPPWRQGHEVARELRNELGLNGHPLRDIESVSSALRVPFAELQRAMLSVSERPMFLDAVVDVNAAGSPGFVLSGRLEEARRLAFCRGLFEYLTSQSGHASIATRARSDRQQRNRAFAAEFLVPASELRRRVDRDVIGEEEIDDLAAEFGVSTFVVRHQLENHGIAKTAPA